MYTFADLFAGIWWFHLAFHNLWNKCVMACDIDEKARKTYEANFMHISPSLFNNNNFYRDICELDYAAIPNFDIVCGGFPCQPFSQAWYKLGFNDHRGNLFFAIKSLRHQIIDCPRIVQEYILSDLINVSLLHERHHSYFHKKKNSHLQCLMYLVEHVIKQYDIPLEFEVNDQTLLIGGTEMVISLMAKKKD